MKKRNGKPDWRKDIPIVKTSSPASVWGYFSKSRKTLQLYVRPEDGLSRATTYHPIVVHIKRDWF